MNSRQPAVVLLLGLSSAYRRGHMAEFTPEEKMRLQETVAELLAGKKIEDHRSRGAPMEFRAASTVSAVGKNCRGTPCPHLISPFAID